MIIYLICVCGAGALFTGIGLYAMRRKELMWFWSGTTVLSAEITDIAAYNRANGVMWLAYSLLYWIAGLLGVWSPAVGGIVLGVAGIAGTAALVLVYGRIYRKYAANR